MFSIDLSQNVFYFKSGEFLAESGWRHKKMFHDKDFEIIFCLENNLSLLIDGELKVLKKNDCLVVPPTTTIEGAHLSTQPVNFYWLHFYADWEKISVNDKKLLQLKKEFIRQDVSSSLTSSCFLPGHFTIKQPNFLILSINQLLNVSNNFYYSPQMTDTLVKSIIIELCNQYLSASTILESEHQTRVHQIADWIRANMNEDLTIYKISEHFELSQDYLSRLFKKEFGKNLRDYLIDLKISVAKVLLVQTTLPIKAISELSYYQDEKYFTRLFKKKINLTPSQYRNAFTGTHLNNPYIDPKIPIPQQVEKLINSKKV